MRGPTRACSRGSGAYRKRARGQAVAWRTWTLIAMPTSLVAPGHVAWPQYEYEPRTRFVNKIIINRVNRAPEAPAAEHQRRPVRGPTFHFFISPALRFFSA